MLKIKDNVDLKELEKFGFKPLYSQETGEIIEYIIDVNNKYSHTFIKIYEKDDYKLCSISRLIREKIIHFHKNLNGKWAIYIGYYLGSELENWQFDLLYDLIKADLVEKVGE